MELPVWCSRKSAQVKRKKVITEYKTSYLNLSISCCTLLIQIISYAPVDRVIFIIDKSQADRDLRFLC